MAFREAFCVIRTSSKFPSLKSAVRIRTCREIPARRICRRSARVSGTGTDCSAVTALKCSDIGLDEPLSETGSGPFFAVSLCARELPIEQGYRHGGTTGRGALTRREVWKQAG